MSWREVLFDALGPGFAAGFSLGDWARLISENRFRIDPVCLPKAASATLCALINTPLRWLEHRIYDQRLAAQPIKPPLFVLGHFRNGTSYLQSLLAVDRRFSYPRASQIAAPHCFLLAERIVAAVGRLLLPPTRFGVDNMALSPDSPTEEESALALITGCSPYLGWMFPRRAEHYRRYLTFREVPAQEVDRWATAYLSLVKKLAYQNGRPLVLKSPPNTCRIALLLNLFPNAKFVHIHRDPYVVYQSTTHLMVRALRIHGFQRPKPEFLHDWIIRQYRDMYDVFFEERGSIPPGRYAEVAFEEFEADPINQMRRIYEKLDLPDFAVVQPPLEKYVCSLSGYQKNLYPPLRAEVLSDIASAARRCIDEWGYSGPALSQ